MVTAVVLLVTEIGGSIGSAIGTSSSSLPCYSPYPLLTAILPFLLNSLPQPGRRLARSLNSRLDLDLAHARQARAVPPLRRRGDACAALWELVCCGGGAEGESVAGGCYYGCGVFFLLGFR